MIRIDIDSGLYVDGIYAAAYELDAHQHSNRLPLAWRVDAKSGGMVMALSSRATVEQARRAESVIASAEADPKGVRKAYFAALHGMSV